MGLKKLSGIWILIRSVSGALAKVLKENIGKRL
jgi:hypothetical protein